MAQAAVPPLPDLHAAHPVTVAAVEAGQLAITGLAAGESCPHLCDWAGVASARPTKRHRGETGSAVRISLGLASSVAALFPRSRGLDQLRAVKVLSHEQVGRTVHEPESAGSRLLAAWAYSWPACRELPHRSRGGSPHFTRPEGFRYTLCPDLRWTAT